MSTVTIFVCRVCGECYHEAGNGYCKKCGGVLDAEKALEREME